MNLIYMPHPGHLCVSRDCKFFLNTCVNQKWIVSTVGEYLPSDEVREIFATTRGVILEGKGDYRLYDYLKKIGYENIGFGRKYETMVFEAARVDDPTTCCQWRMADGREKDSAGYNEPSEAYKGHMAMIQKWRTL